MVASRRPIFSSFIYLVMETLSRLVNKAIGVGFLEGFQITNAQSESTLISRLLCADDILFFFKPNESFGILETYFAVI